MTHAPLVFFNKYSWQPDVRLGSGSPGSAGKAGVAFVPGKMFFGAGQEPAETVPFLWHFLSPQGREMPACPCISEGQNMCLSL